MCTRQWHFLSISEIALPYPIHMQKKKWKNMFWHFYSSIDAKGKKRKKIVLFSGESTSLGNWNFKKVRDICHGIICVMLPTYFLYVDQVK